MVNSFSTIIIRDMGFSTTKTTELKSVGDAVQIVAYSLFGEGAISPLDDIEREVVNRMLDPVNGVMPEMRAILRTKLNLGPEPPLPGGAGAATNAVPESASSK